MAEVIYHNKEGNSNKFWSYEIKGNRIVFKWGRVGLAGQQKEEPYSPAKLQKKISEKQKKGYDLIDKEKLAKEKNLADGLGFRVKIQKLDFVSVTEFQNGKLRLTVMDEYDPTQYIFVHLQNSWNTDENRWLLLSAKHGHKELRQSGANWTVYTSASGRTANAIMEYLQDMIAKVTKIITASFGSLGGRALDDDSYQKVVDTFKSESGIEQNDQVIGQIAKMGFANLGGRRLDL